MNLCSAQLLLDQGAFFVELSVFLQAILETLSYGCMMKIDILIDPPADKVID